MTSPNQELEVVRALLEALHLRGAQVPSAHVAQPDGKAADHALTDRELAQRDLNWLAQSHCLVAEVSTPSHGVGVEVMAAVTQKIPVLLLARQGAPVSRLLVGLPGVRFQRYTHVADAVGKLLAFLQEVEETS